VRDSVGDVVISDNQGNFDLGKADLPDDVRAKLDELASRLKAAPRAKDGHKTGAS
jgi:outer membrane protein OmpA-like peptidoglycan-associated protein